ncbi:hypothetical protein GY45DRAFT_1436346 [Cubamyces sp. BRFM 1775]|nr:hypothetical protein GY45DRAFT_1436346 [Cubamyces sp. BRFM 1775]
MMDLRYAESVNDLLMAVYDILKAHRRMALKHHILHCDMSLLNMLICPQRRPPDGKISNSWMADMSALVGDVLSGTPSRPKSRGLLIEYDHSCMSNVHKAIRRELTCRTGTPTFIACAVAVAALPCGAAHLEYERMPVLEGKAKEMYVNAYGQALYETYTDSPESFTCHGGVPRSGRRKDIQVVAQSMPFYHRCEYDAESVFWTMYSVLLRVLPLNSQETIATGTALRTAWGILESHTIPKGEEVASYADRRSLILNYSESSFLAAFLPVMQDVGRMLFNVKEHVVPTWAIMDPPPPFEDHLHEAIQRHILSYLVEHEDNPIPLTPGVLRSIIAKEDGRKL